MEKNVLDIIVDILKKEDSFWNNFSVNNKVCALKNVLRDHDINNESTGENFSLE